MAIRRLTFAALAGAVLATAALAGPPIICHPIACEESKSLPYGDGAFDYSKSYRKSRLVGDTVKYLDGSECALYHMETIRRAAVYVRGDEALGSELLGALTMRVLDAEASGKPSALAWMDAAFLVACFNETRLMREYRQDVGKGIDAYAWAKKAVDADPDNAAIQFAAALVTHPAMTRGAESRYKQHVSGAAVGAEKGSLLEKNLAGHIKQFGSSIEEVRAEAKRNGITRVSSGG